MERSRYADKNPTQLNGFMFFPPEVIEPVPEHKDDIYYRVKDFDNLGNLSYKFFLDMDYRWFIARANNITDEVLELKTNMIIRIPALQTLISYAGGL